MRNFLKHRTTRCTAWTIVLALMIQIAPVDTLAASMKARQQTKQTEKKQPDVRKLSSAEMSNIYGSGHRNRFRCGTMPWHRSLRDVNMSNGNLFKSFTDIQVAPGRGAGLVLQRTYNSNEERIGPFGRGWTHAYEIRMEERYDLQPDPLPIDLDKVEKTDFFGGRHIFQRDADGLYTPPAYLHCDLSSEYMDVVANGMAVSSDTEEGMDGTVKHYTQIGNARVCDSITDRFGNQTLLTYNTIGGTARLYQVTDPVGRTLTFAWSNEGAAYGDTAWRVTRIDGPQQLSVTYEYYKNRNDQDEWDDRGGEWYNLKKVHVDPENLNRTTVYTYTNYQDDYGLLAGIYNTGNGSNDRLLVVEYGYGILVPACEPYQQENICWTLGGSLWVTTIKEPGKKYGAEMKHKIWTIDWKQYYLLTPDETGYIMHAVMQPEDSPSPVLAIAVGSYNTDGTPFRGYYPLYGMGFTHHKWYGSYPITTFQPTEDGQYRHEATRPDSFTDEQWLIDRPSMTRCYEYGLHGNVLRSWYLGFEGVEETTEYYCEDKYFQKASVTDMAGKTTLLDYGSKDDSIGTRGNPIRVRNADGYITRYTYNGYGQKERELVFKDQETEQGDNYVLTKYGYDNDGNLSQVIQDACHDGCPTPCTAHLNRTTSMTYDDAGRVTDRTDPMTRSSHIDYNELGQPKYATFPSAGSVPGESVSYGYDPYGRLETVTVSRTDGGQIITDMDYDEGTERVNSVTETVNVGGVSRESTIQYGYNTAGELVQKVLDDGATWTYDYDTHAGIYGAIPKDDPNSVCHNLKSITMTKTDQPTRRVEYSSDGYGLLFQARVYPDASNDDECYKTDYRYDLEEGAPAFGRSRLWLTSMVTTWNYMDGDDPAWKLIRSNEYTSFDNVGNRKNNIIGYRGVDDAIHNQTETYDYDNLHRLWRVYYGSDVQTYAFDYAGNRLEKTDSVSDDEGYAYNAANMIESRTTSQNTIDYTCDANGNTVDEMIGQTHLRQNTWDSQNRLVQCVYNGNTSSFVYGADGLRRRSTVGSTTTDYVLDVQSVVQEGHVVNQQLVVDTTYLTGVRGPECRIDSNGSARWSIFDGLGSAVQEVDGAGNVTVVRNMDVYGLPRSAEVIKSGETSGKHKFVGSLGHTSEGETGLIYMQARYMDPALGRFISEDSTRNGANWYAYCQDNPVGVVDPDGCRSVGVVSLAAYAVGVAYTAEAISLWMNYSWTKATSAAATGYAGLAIVSFAIASVGLVDSQAINYITGAMVGAASVISSIAQIMGNFTAKASSRIGAVAVMAVVGYTLMLTGVLISIGLEVARNTPAFMPDMY